MKKTILTTILLATTLFAFTQARVGFTKSEIHQECKINGQDVSSGYTDKGTHYSVTETKHVITIFFYDENNVCIRSTVNPINDIVRKAYIDTFNEQCVVVDSTHWLLYTDMGVQTIVLVYSDTVTPFFLFENEK